MNYKISHPTKIIECEIDLPSSKSISNRLLIIQALCKKKFLIHNLSNSNDTTTLKNALNSRENVIDVGGAGTSFRFLTSYFSIKKEVNLILTGNSRMQERPIKALAKALIDIGAKIEYTDHLNFPPLKITGTKIKGGKVSVDGTKSSQFISSLLLIAPVLENGLEIEIIGDLVSKPYVQMTLSLMKQFGISYSWEKNVIIIRPQEYIATDFTVEADWSAASFWFQIACLSKKCNIRLNGLSEKSIQGDKEIRDLFRNLGVESIFKKGTLFLTKKNNILKQNIIDLKNILHVSARLVLLFLLTNFKAIHCTKYTGGLTQIIFIFHLYSYLCFGLLIVGHGISISSRKTSKLITFILIKRSNEKVKSDFV